MALKLEQEGRRYFREAADSAESQQARQTFEFLAAEENKHIERINEFYQSIKDTGGTEPACFGDFGCAVGAVEHEYQSNLI